jgi:DNA-binding response OmpR family regulator
LIQFTTRAANEINVSGMGRGLILFVDDEPHILRFVSMVLEQAGFEVVTAPSGAEAIALTQARPFDAVVLDYGLPGLDGAQTLVEIRKARPAIAAIFSSGRVSPQLAAEAQRQGATALEKPYRISELVAALEGALGKEKK